MRHRDEPARGDVIVLGASRPATRLLAMLEILEARGRVGGRELAERLEVDPRTVRRYAVKLGELGIPVEAERGPYGGYRLRPGYKLPPLMLTDAEATAVVLGLLVSRQAGIWVEESAIEEALTKILRILPTELGERVGALEGTLGSTWRPREPQPPATEVVLTLASAIRRRRRVAIRYATPGRAETDRTVAPYGLVLHAGRWYLAAHDDRSGEVRTFRVDRVRWAETRRERSTIPEGFDAADHVTRSLARLPWGREFEVVFETTIEEARRRIPRAIGEPEEIEGGVRLRARVDDLGMAARMLVSFGWAFTVRDPPELRAVLRYLAGTLEAASAEPG
ncbi:MAG TPA: YafY family protein [Actinomycetota bacterium]|nr:YafY family protein [Actinomycetota bacterium]